MIGVACRAPRASVENEAVHERAARGVETELNVDVVVGVVRRIGDLESLPPFAADHLVVLVLAGLQLEEIGVHSGENSRAVRLRTLDHVGELLASAQLILRACDSQVEIFPAQVDPDEIHHERAALVGELTVAHPRCQLVGDDCIPRLREDGDGSSGERVIQSR